jgi:cation:H+ antiporter
VAPLTVDQKLVRLEVPLMIGISLLVLIMALDGEVLAWEGVILVALLLAYTGFLALKGRNESPAVEEEWASGLGTDAKPLAGGMGRILFSAGSLGMVAAGLVLLVVGSGWLLDSAVAIARWLGVSELVIGLTLVAGGTSLPELATSVSASLQGKRDIAVGNVVGSNLFNILCVLGISATLSAGIPVRPISLYLDLPVMIAASVVCLPVFFSGGRVSRWEGSLLMGGYVIYIFCLYLFSR